MKSKSTGTTGSGAASADELSGLSGRYPRGSSSSAAGYSSARRAARALEQELNGLNIPTSYLPTPSRASASRALEEELSGLNIPTSYLPAPSRASASRALEEELNGLNIPTSYLPTHGPSPSRGAAPDDGDVYSSAARRLGLSRTLSMRERPASPGVTGSYRPSLLSSLSSPGQGPGRRPYSSYSTAMSLSDSERPPLPRRSSGLGLSGLGHGLGHGLGLARASDDDCAYYEIMPSQRSECSSSSSIFTRSCPSGAFLGDAASAARSPSGSFTPGASQLGPATPALATPALATPSQEELPAPGKTEPSAAGSTSPAPAEPVDAVPTATAAPTTTAFTTTSAPAAQSVPRTMRSVSVTREVRPSPASSLGLGAGSTTDLTLRRSASTRATPERSILSKFFRGSSSGDEQPKAAKAKQPVQRRISRFLRPDFFDTPREESAYAKEQDLQRSRSAAKDLQCEAQQEDRSGKDAKDAKNAKDAKDAKDSTKTSSRFLQSLERRLERLRTGQPQPTPAPAPAPPPPPPPPPAPAAPAAPSAAPSRIESTIRSLREHSLEPKEADAAPTESSLLQRAVSVSDIAPASSGGSGGSGSGSSRIAGRVMSLFRKDPADVKQGLIPSFRPHRSYTGSTSDSVLDGAERTRRKKVVEAPSTAVRGSPSAAEPRDPPVGPSASPSAGPSVSPSASPSAGSADASAAPPSAVSVDVSIVLPSRDKNRDFGISCAKEVSSPSAGPVIIPSSVEKVGADADRTEGVMTSGSAEKGMANGDVNVEVNVSATVDDSAATDPKPTKVSRTKSGSKVKGLLSSKSKTKIVKSKKDPEVKTVEGDDSTGLASSVTTECKTEIGGSTPLPSQVGADSSSSGPLTLLRDVSEDPLKSLDTDVHKTGNGSTLKQTVKVKPSKFEEVSDGPFVRSFSKIKLAKDEQPSAPRKSLSKSKIPVDDKVPVLPKSYSKSRLSDSGKSVVGQSTNGLDLSTPTGQVNGGLSVSKLSSKVIVAKTEGNSVEIPLKSSSKKKLRKDEEKEASPVKYVVSRSSICKEEAKPKEVSPVKTFSKSLKAKEEVEPSASKEQPTEVLRSSSTPPKDEEKINSTKETSPVKSISKPLLRSREDSKPSLEKEKSLVKSPSRSSVQRDNIKSLSDKPASVLKSTSRSSLRHKDDAKSTADKEPSLVKSSSRSSVLSKEAPKEKSLVKSSSRSSVLSKEASKESTLVKSSSRSSVLSRDQSPLLKSSSRSSVRKDELTKPVKSLSRTRIAKDEAADLSVVSDPAATPPLLMARSSSRTKLLRSDEKTPPRTPPKSAAGDDASRVVTSPARSASRTKISTEAERRSPTKNGTDVVASPLRKSLSRGALPKEADKVVVVSRSSSRTKVSSKAESPVSKSPSKSKVFSKADSPVSKSPSKTKVLKSSDAKKTVAEAGGIPKASSKSPPSKEDDAPRVAVDADKQGEAQDEVRSTARPLRKSSSRGGEALSPVRRAVSSSPGLRLGHSPSPSPGPSHGLRVPQQRGHRARERGANGHGHGHGHAPLRHRSVSHTRPAVADDPDIPVVSLKDVERRHREMLLDKWSRSLQSLHEEQNKQARAQSEAAAPREGATGVTGATAIPAPMSGPRPRPTLHLDLFPVATPAAPAPAPLQPRGTSPAPSDSWSVCSDASPSPTPPSPSADEGPESVSDRIRRKSFYTRFNDIKKKKKKPGATSPSSSSSTTLGASLLASPSARPRPVLDLDDALYGATASVPRPRPVLDLDDALYGATASVPRPRRSPAVSPVAGLPSRTKYLNGGLFDAAVVGAPSAVTSPSVLAMDRSPTWERSGIELRNDLKFHNLGLHRFDPNNLSVKKESLFELLSPTSSGPAPSLGAAPAKPTSPAATPSAPAASLSGAPDSGSGAGPSEKPPETRLEAAAADEPQTT